MHARRKELSEKGGKSERASERATPACEIHARSLLRRKVKAFAKDVTADAQSTLFGNIFILLFASVILYFRMLTIIFIKTITFTCICY